MGNAHLHLNLWEWLKEQTDFARYKPKLVSGIEIQKQTSAKGEGYYVLKNPQRWTYLKLPDRDFFLFELMDGRRSVKELVVAYFAKFGAFAFDRVENLIWQLKRKGFLEENLADVFEHVKLELSKDSWGHKANVFWQSFLINHEDLLEFYQKHYVAKNMVVSVCGDIDHEDIASYVSEKFAALPSGEEQRPSKIVEPKLLGIRRSHLEKDLHQTNMIMGTPAASMKAEDQDKYALKLIDKLLGSGGSSRLFQKLSEQQGLVYSVYSQAPMSEDEGYVAVYAACSPENIRAVETSIVDEWRQIRSEPVTVEELLRAKRCYEGTIAREFETNLSIASVFGIEALLHRIEPFGECIQKANSVTKEDIIKAANEYLHPDRYVIVTVGRK